MFSSQKKGESLRSNMSPSKSIDQQSLAGGGSQSKLGNSANKFGSGGYQQQ